MTWNVNNKKEGDFCQLLISGTKNLESGTISTIKSLNQLSNSIGNDGLA